MILENLRVNRVIMHEIFKRDNDRELVSPSYSDAIERLDPEAQATFQMRVTDALSAQSKSMEMRITELDDLSVIANAEKIVYGAAVSNDQEFIDVSKYLALKLAKAQTSRRYLGGVVIVFEGKFGVPERSFVGVIKAETQSGFRRLRDKEKVLTQFLNDIFLTPAQRLYKIGFVVPGKQSEGREGWSCFIFDSNITANQRESAAQYFYESFMGCTFPSNGAYETSKFFDLTKKFVRNSNLSSEDKRDINDALFTFVKVEQSPTFTSHEFADKYLPIEVRDGYNAFLQSNKFPERAVIRDISDMGTRLKRRKFKFGSDVEVSASPEALRSEKVQIKTVDAENFGGGSGEMWTQIIIRQQMTDQQ
ncbi:nucleoid-associated protein [Brucella tritici]|uniref:nucleoid-associated protein n=1 Tax=Brucella tritici TaxID=94626 RepID=UPI003D6D5E75